MIKLSVAAERLDTSGANLRAAIARGSLAVTRCPCGREWMVEESEVERFRRENRRSPKAAVPA
jgi:predicted site-specific integrase-resolvase